MTLRRGGQAGRVAGRLRHAMVCGLLGSVAFLGTAAAQAEAFLPNKGNIAAPSGAREICSTYNWACAFSNAAPLVDLSQLNKVNRKVNRAVRSISDEAQYRRADHWTLPSRRGGDCEDFALLKKRELVKLGYSPQNLMLTTVLDRRGNSHAVLIARTEQGDFVIDNLNNNIRPWQGTGYTFLRMQDPKSPKRWIRLNVKG